MERLTQFDGRTVDWPTLESAKDLSPLDDKKIRVLALHEKRRLSNMPPPTVREIGEYVGINSTGHVSSLLARLVKENYLNDCESEDSTPTSRRTTIRIDFKTIKPLNNEEVSIHQFPDQPGLTSPIKK